VIGGEILLEITQILRWFMLGFLASSTINHWDDPTWICPFSLLFLTGFNLLLMRTMKTQERNFRYR